MSGSTEKTAFIQHETLLYAKQRPENSLTRYSTKSHVIAILGGSVARSLTQNPHNSRLKTAQKPPKNFPENRPKKPTIFCTYFAVLAFMCL